jgi:hypothetical protein
VEVLDVDAAAAGVLDDVALDDDDELDPHPPITAAVMATTTAPAPMRARLDLNMGATPPLPTGPHADPRLNLRPARSSPGSAQANRFDQLAASPRG